MCSALNGFSFSFLSKGEKESRTKEVVARLFPCSAFAGGP